jgi:hypothetical protein
MIATFLVGLSLTIGQSDAPRLGAPVPATGGVQLLVPVDYQKQPKADHTSAVLPAFFLSPSAPAPKAIPDSTSPNGNGNTFWKADADLRQPLLFAGERERE